MRTLVIGYWPSQPLDVKRIAAVEDLLGSLGEVEHFDMTHLPEKGDALDHIEDGYDLVIALHLCYSKDEDGKFFYCRKNKDIFDLCEKTRTSLAVFGDGRYAFEGIRVKGAVPFTIRL